LLHGAWHGGWWWAPVADRLTDQGYAVLAPTMPGHGVTDDRAGITNAQCADALVDFLDKRDVHDAILVGHSWAGTLISTVAPRLLDRLHGLVYMSAFVLEP